MIIAWRLVPEPRLSEAFLGEGARLFGGRWNHKGTRAVYVSESLALAVLEQFVHVGLEGRYMKFVYMRVDIPDEIKMKTVDMKSLPEGWDRAPILSVTMDIGTEWVRRGETAILKVPSAVITSESNFLLNPEHTDFSKIKIGEPRAFRFDPRMWKNES